MSNIFRQTFRARRKSICTVASMSAMSGIGAFSRAGMSSAITCSWSISTWRNWIRRLRVVGCGQPAGRRWPGSVAQDHFGDPNMPLDTYVRDLAEQQTGRRPQGPIRLLTHLRYFGYCINPISVYYCFKPDGEDAGFPRCRSHQYALGRENRLCAGRGRSEQRQPARRISESHARFAVPADGPALRLAFHPAWAASGRASGRAQGSVADARRHAQPAPPTARRPRPWPGCWPVSRS